MIFIPNCHWNYAKLNFGTTLVAIWYEYHTSVFAVQFYSQKAIVYISSGITLFIGECENSTNQKSFLSNNYQRSQITVSLI